MKPESKKDVIGVASHALLGRLLFVYALNGVVKCFSADEIRPLESAMMDIGWKHTATIDPARWIEEMANGDTEPSDMLDELQFCPPNIVLSKPHNQHDETTNSPINGNHTVDVDPGTQPADASNRSGHTGVRDGMVN